MAGALRTLRAQAERMTSRAQGLARISSTPGATYPWNSSTRTASSSPGFQKHFWLASRKPCNKMVHCISVYDKPYVIFVLSGSKQSIITNSTDDCNTIYFVNMPKKLFGFKNTVFMDVT